MAGMKPQIPPHVVAKWQEHLERRLAGGATTLWSVAREISRDSHYSTSTVYKYLKNLQDPQGQILDLRISYRHRGRIKSNPIKYISKVFGTDTKLNIETIASRLSEYCEGIPFRIKTVELVLHRYASEVKEGRLRGPLLKETRNGVWHYSPDLKLLKKVWKTPRYSPKQRRAYVKYHPRLYRNPQYYLEHAFKDTSNITLDEIASSISQIADGVIFSERVLNKFLKCYSAAQRELRSEMLMDSSLKYLEEISEGVWRYGFPGQP